MFNNQFYHSVQRATQRIGMKTQHHACCKSYWPKVDSGGATLSSSAISSPYMTRTFNAEHFAGMRETSLSFRGIQGGSRDEKFVDFSLAPASEKVRRLASNV